MSYRYLDIIKINLKSKRKRNQFINEFIKNNYSDLMITKKEFKKRHKTKIIQMFNNHGWNKSTETFIEDCLESYYWYKDPLCYKTCLDNEDYTDFNDKFINIFGKDILTNKKFLRKIHILKHKELNSGY